MKKINSSLSGVFMLLVCLFSVQTVFAVDVPLKKDNPGPGTMMLSRSVSTVIPALVTLNDAELGIFFSKSVGVAQIVIEDETGAVVYQEAIDTSLTFESIIDTSCWDSGNYTVTISYGTTNLTGTFQL